jgi:ABC-type branched-subunit amino acid transport system permease subunit
MSKDTPPTNESPEDRRVALDANHVVDANGTTGANGTKNSARPTNRSIGKDEWVEQAGDRRAETSFARIRRRLVAIPVHWRVLGVGLIALLFTFVSPTDYTTRVAFTVALYTLLATGLNLVVGWAGLLDLGYAAFFGFGAYGYALLSSDKFDLHWPSIVSVPVVVCGAAALGYVLGLPSRRLSGDYLAIVTLFFGQIFVSIANNGDRLQLTIVGNALPKKPWNLTNGPNGVTDIDPLSMFGYKVRSITAYYIVAVVAAIIVMLLFYRLRNSRSGLALRSMREDPLAAEILSVPVRKLRLIAFALGAGVAGLSGILFASIQQSVFGSNFDLPFLVLLYVAAILGGLGNLGGGFVGAFVVAVLPELLRTPSTGRLLVYGALVLFVALRIRNWGRLLQFIGALISVGIVVRIGLELFNTELRPRSSGVAGLTGSLVPHLLNSVKFGNTAFLLLIGSGLALTTVAAKWRPIGGGVVAYIGMLAWENRLAEQASITRQLLVGAALVAIMASRPQGIFGAKRVEVL